MTISRIWHAFRVAPASERDLQAVARPVVDRESPGHRRVVYQSARSCCRAVRRREIADPSAGPLGPPAADATGPSRTPHPRLHTARDDVVVCGARCADWPRSSARRTAAIGRWSSASSSIVSTRGCRRTSTYISSWTTTAHIRPPLIRAWFAKRPRFHVHFTPTYGSWLNLIERWFAELTTKQLRRGVHRSVPALEAAIREFIEAHNTKGRPFVWTKSADEILASIGRFAQRTLNLTPARQHMSRTIGTGH